MAAFARSRTWSLLGLLVVALSGCGADVPTSAPDASPVTLQLVGAQGDASQFRYYEGVTRSLQGNSPSERAASLVDLMIAGPNDEERDRGLSSGFPDDPDLLDAVTVEGDMLVLDFHHGIVEAAGLTGDTGGTGLLGSLLANAFTLDGIDSFELRGDGSCQTFVAWGDSGLGGDLAETCTVRTRADAETWMLETATEPPPVATDPGGPQGPPEPLCGRSQPDCVEPAPDMVLG